MKWFIVLLFIFPLIVFAFHLELKRQPFGGKLKSVENCENGIILEIESYHHKSYFQKQIEKVIRSFIFVTKTPDEFECYDDKDNNKSTEKSINFTPSVSLNQIDKIYIGTAKKDGTCVEKYQKIIDYQEVILEDGTTLFVPIYQDCYRNRKNVDYSIVIIGGMMKYCNIFPKLCSR